MTETINITQLITEGIQERKGKGISIVDLSHIESAATERFIIC
jgi:ribosomal silencing factor RsfS